MTIAHYLWKLLTMQRDHASRFGRKHETRDAGERRWGERNSAERRSAVDE